MALMHLEVFEALRSAGHSEETAIRGAVALHEALAKERVRRSTPRVQLAGLIPELAGLRTEMGDLRTDMRVLVGMTALSALLVTVLFIKLFFG